VGTVKACLIGQTENLAPADKKLYALRDVTATVDCLPLIASSIMSKKLAAGLDALVLDVKVGSGAFMKTPQDARRLARTMIDIGGQMGRKVVALLTDMDQPLGRAVGNALEVMEAVELLQGRAAPDFTEVTLALTAEMLVLGKVAQDTAQARGALQAVISSGAAPAKFAQIVQAQHGDPRAVHDLSLLPRARHQADLRSPCGGVVTGIDCEAVGLAAVALGAGRARVDSVISPGVGFLLQRKVGDKVAPGEVLLTIHYDDPEKLQDVQQRLLGAYRFGSEAPPARPLILDRLE
jgi:pyrimidine-nucleoside phosphorylase